MRIRDKLQIEFAFANDSTEESLNDENHVSYVHSQYSGVVQSIQLQAVKYT